MKTLKSIILFCILHFAFCIYSNAQIVYTDVNPWTSLNCTGTSCSFIYYLDLNNDGVNDYKITYLHGPSNPHSINCTCTPAPYYNTTLEILPLANNEYYYNLDSGTAINSTSTWIDTTNSELYYSYHNCHPGIAGSCSWSSLLGGGWSGEKYIPLRLHMGTNLFYGWMRLLIVNPGAGGSFEIKDFAFNATANQSILAGQRCTPQANIKANGSLSFCSGGSVVLTSKNSGNTLVYQWKKNNVNIPGATNKNYTATAAGDYKVKVTDTINNCYKTSGIKTITVPCRLNNETFTEQLENPFELKISPNPFSNSTTISFTISKSQDVSMNIFDLNGRLIQSLADNIFEEGNHSIEWNADKVNAGIYFLKMQAGENLQTEKLIVTK